MGFCLFSNVAIAARYLQRRHGVGRLAIVDFDVHHGNGTQAAFEDDGDVLFISLHQHPSTCYPGSGHEWETGVGAGEGATINIPFDPGSEDDDYLRAFDSKVVPALERFRPEFMLVSAGFDAHRDDPLAQMNLSEEAYERMTRLLVQVADVHCGGRLVSALEGGYNLRALGRSVVRHLIGMQNAE
jgi:acetoin utilization deacetylase AcuC-like enzyme